MQTTPLHTPQRYLLSIANQSLTPQLFLFLSRFNVFYRIHIHLNTILARGGSGGRAERAAIA